MPLISDAAAPLKRALHIETLTITDEARCQFDLEVPPPAVLRHVYCRSAKVAPSIVGSKPGSAIVVVLVFEVDPDAPPATRRYYALLYGKVVEGAAVVDMLFAGIGTLPNGAPIAVYELPPMPPAAPLPVGGPGSLLSTRRTT